jgi:dual specificity phosphatase 12
LQDYGITHVLTLLSSRTRPKIPEDLGVVHKTIEIDDDALADLLGVLEESSAFIEKALREKGGKVLVHCLQGISRSGAVIVAHLMKMLGIGYEEALERARNSRETIRPNKGFEEQMKLWHEMQFNLHDEQGGEKDLYKEWKEKRDQTIENGDEEMRGWEAWRDLVPDGW